MAETAKKMVEVVDEIDAMKMELDSVKAELEDTKKELEQYKQAYLDQGERYNRLFGLFANNIDYFVVGQKQNNN